MSVAKSACDWMAEAAGSSNPSSSSSVLPPQGRFTLATSGAHLPKVPISVMTLNQLLNDKSMAKPSQSQWIALLVSVARVFETRVVEGHTSELTLDDVTVTNAYLSGTSEPLHVEMASFSPKRSPAPTRDSWMIIFARFCFQAATRLNWNEISASRNQNALIRDALVTAPGIMTVMEEVWRCARGDSPTRAKNEPSRHSSTLLHISPALRVFNTNGFSSSVSVPRPDSIPSLVQLLGCEERKEWQVSALVALERVLSSSLDSQSAAMMLCHWIDRIVPTDVTVLDGTHQNKNVCDLSIYITRLNIVASLLWELMKKGDLDVLHRMQRRVQSLGIERHLNVDDIVHFTPIFLKRRHLVVVARLTVSCCFKNTTICGRFMTPYNVRSIAYKILETSVPMTKDANDQYTTLLSMMLVMSDFGSWCGKDGSLIVHDKSKIMRWWDYMDDDLFVKYALPCFSFDIISYSTCKYITSKLEIIAWNEAVKHADLRHVSTYSADVLPQLKLQAAKLTNVLAWLTSIAWHSDSQVKAASPRGVDAANAAAVIFQHHAHHYIAVNEDAGNTVKEPITATLPHTVESIVSAVESLCAASSASGVLYEAAESQEVVALDAQRSSSSHNPPQPSRWRSVIQQQPMAPMDMERVPQELRQVDERTHLLFKPAPCEGITASYANSKYMFTLSEGDIRHGWCSMRHIECNMQTCERIDADEEESSRRLPPFEKVVFQTLSPICKSTQTTLTGTSGMICFDIDGAGDTCDIVIGLSCKTQARDSEDDGNSNCDTASSADDASTPSDIFQWRLATGMISYNGVQIPYASPCTTGSGVAIGIAGRHVYLVKDGMFFPPLRQSPITNNQEDAAAAPFDNPLFTLPLDAQVHISVTIGCPSVRLGARIMNADWKEEEFASFEDRNPIAYELMHANNASSQCPHQHVRKEWTVKLGGIPITGNLFPSLTPMQQQLVTLIHRAREKCPGESTCTMMSHFCKPIITLAEEINKRF